MYVYFADRPKSSGAIRFKDERVGTCEWKRDRQRTGAGKWQRVVSPRDARSPLHPPIFRSAPRLSLRRYLTTHTRCTTRILSHRPDEIIQSPRELSPREPKTRKPRKSNETTKVQVVVRLSILGERFPNLTNSPIQHRVRIIERLFCLNFRETIATSSEQV